MLLLYAFTLGKSPVEKLFGSFNGNKWRTLLTRIGEGLGTVYLRIVPRCCRSGGCTFLHLVHGWGLNEIVERGRWKKYESTHSYLDAGLYAAVMAEVPEGANEEGRDLEVSFPRKCPWPRDLLRNLPASVRGLFVT